MVYTFIFTYKSLFGCQLWRSFKKTYDEDSICYVEKVHKNLNLQYG